MTASEPDRPEAEPRAMSRRRTRTAVLLSLVVLSLFGSFWIGRVTRGRSDGEILFGPAQTFGEARSRFPKQLAYLLGQTRLADGVTYGEWVRARFVRQCEEL